MITENKFGGNDETRFSGKTRDLSVVCAYDNQAEVASWQSITFEIPIKLMNIAVTKSKQEHKKPDLVCSKNAKVGLDLVWASHQMLIVWILNVKNNINFNRKLMDMRGFIILITSILLTTIELWMRI